MPIIKFGFDPTGKSIHLGRTVPLIKLRQMQNEGWFVSLLVGDFTALIGDPSDKLGKRPQLTHEQISENEKKSLPLIFKILDKNKTIIRHNSDWWDGARFKHILELAGRFSVQQMTARRNFSLRMKAKEPISLRELFYPILQGYDSYMLQVDAEIGGEDQIFNMNIGRDIQEYYGKKPQEVITVPLLPGTDGEKMSTTTGNTINIDDEPRVMFDKIMSVRDEVAPLYGEHCLLEPFKYDGGDIREYKIELANRLVSFYHPEWEYLNPLFQKNEKGRVQGAAESDIKA